MYDWSFVASAARASSRPSAVTRRCARSGRSRAARAPARSANASSSAKRNAPLQRDARVRRLAARVAADERRRRSRGGTPRAGRASRAAARARGTSRAPRSRRSGEQQARSPSGPAGSIQSRSVTPSACRPGAQQRDGAVDAAAHRDGDALGMRLRAEDLRERVRERVDGQRLAADRRSLEQRQPVERRARARARRPRRCGRRRR